MIIDLTACAIARGENQRQSRSWPKETAIATSWHDYVKSRNDFQLSQEDVELRTEYRGRPGAIWAIALQEICNHDREAQQRGLQG